MSRTVRILGVDPGTHRTGWGLVDMEAGRPLRHVAHGMIQTDAKAPLWERLHRIHGQLELVLLEHHPHALALEQCFVGKNIQSALKLGHTRGAILVACTEAGLDIHEFAPSLVKSAVTGNGRADKLQVADMVRVLLGLAERAQADASDALAAAICCAHGWNRAGLRRAW